MWRQAQFKEYMSFYVHVNQKNVHWVSLWSSQSFQDSKHGTQMPNKQDRCAEETYFGGEQNLRRNPIKRAWRPHRDGIHGSHAQFILESDPLS